MSNRGYIKRKFLAPLLETGLLVMTVPAKPTSPQQKYQSTERGILLIAQNNEVQNEK